MSCGRNTSFMRTAQISFIKLNSYTHWCYDKLLILILKRNREYSKATYWPVILWTCTGGTQFNSFSMLMRSTRDGRTNSTVSCGLQNDVISSHEDVILAATFLSSGHRNAGGQRIFLTCGSKFHLILLLFHTPTSHISRISGSDNVVAHIFRPISFITTRTMELLNGRIREMSHNAGDSCFVL